MSEGRRGLAAFGWLVAALFACRLALGVVLVPPAAAAVLSALASVVFVAVPVYAVFRASTFDWTAKVAFALVAAGGASHVLGAVALANFLPQAGFVTVVVQALVQAAIAVWCLGLGAAVALLVKDRNLILPVGLFLAGLDVFLVFNPDAPTAKIVRQAPQVFQSMAISVPAARSAGPTTAPGARVVPQAYIGPADLLFASSFFVMLARHRMRVRQTALWLIPVMVAYLALVLSPLGLTLLPALVPIGLTVLLVNRHEFSMTSEERAMAWVAAALSLALAGYGLFAHFRSRPTAPPAGPWTQETDPETEGSAMRRPPEAANPPR